MQDHLTVDLSFRNELLWNEIGNLRNAIGNLFLNLPLRRRLSAMGGLFFESEV